MGSGRTGKGVSGNVGGGGTGVVGVGVGRVGVNSICTASAMWGVVWVVGSGSGVCDGWVFDG